jgi:hypothetical protein
MNGHFVKFVTKSVRAKARVVFPIEMAGKNIAGQAGGHYGIASED